MAAFYAQACALAILAATLAPSLALAQWDAGVNYDGQALVYGPVTANFTRNKPTVDDNGAPVAANVRRFASKPVALAGYVDWQVALPNALGTNATLLGAGPDHFNSQLVPVLVALNNNTETMYVFQLDETLGPPVSAWSLAVAIIRPQMSQTVLSTGKMVDGSC